MNPETPVDPLIRSQVLSGSVRGNLLLWDGSNIKVEICRKNGRSCHAGPAQPFALEDGQLMTMGGDGAVRVRHGRGPGGDGSWRGPLSSLWSLLQVWDLDSIDVAELSGDSSRVEVEPVSELLLGHGASLASVVRSPRPGSFLWFAQVRTRLSQPAWGRPTPVSPL